MKTSGTKRVLKHNNSVLRPHSLYGQPNSTHVQLTPTTRERPSSLRVPTPDQSSGKRNLSSGRTSSSGTTGGPCRRGDPSRKDPWSRPPRRHRVGDRLLTGDLNLRSPSPDLPRPSTVPREESPTLPSWVPTPVYARLLGNGEVGVKPPRSNPLVSTTVDLLEASTLVDGPLI